MPLTSKPVRVRFAPSPTGRTHLGSGRTALYNYLLARQTGGQFILRIEDTDQKRYVPGAEEELIGSLRWLGHRVGRRPGRRRPVRPLPPVGAPEIYQEHARQLVERGQAYPCFCTPERLEQCARSSRHSKQTRPYDGTCRRLDPGEAPPGESPAASGTSSASRCPRRASITVRDLLRGEITVENRNLDDYDPGQVRRAGALPPGGDGRRSPDGDHPRHPRLGVAARPSRCTSTSSAPSAGRSRTGCTSRSSSSRAARAR